MTFHLNKDILTFSLTLFTLSANKEPIPLYVCLFVHLSVSLFNMFLNAKNILLA